MTVKKMTMMMRMTTRKEEEKMIQLIDFPGPMKSNSDMVRNFSSELSLFVSTEPGFLTPTLLGEKAITSLALDPGGARVLSGGIDYELKFWDFAGMDPSLRYK